MVKNIISNADLLVNESLLNNLKCSIDWMEFTVTVPIDVPELISKFNLDYTDFKKCEHGGLGYKSMLKHILYDIIILYDGNEDMGIHIQVKGSAISYFLFTFAQKYIDEDGSIDVLDFKYDTFFPTLLDMILELGHFTRIDLAIDDMGMYYYSIQDVLSLIENECCVSKFRDYQYIKKASISSNDIKGSTIYFGSRQSDIMLRIYDKGKEKGIDFPWIRWELELKGDKANVTAKQLLEDSGIGFTAIGILNHYVRFIIQDNKNRTRCSLQKKWSKFIAEVKKVSLRVEPKQLTPQEKEDWIKRQCMPTIAGLVKYHQGDMSFLWNHIQEHYDRLTAAQKKLFETEWEDDDNEWSFD